MGKSQPVSGLKGRALNAWRDKEIQIEKVKEAKVRGIIELEKELLPKIMQQLTGDDKASFALDIQPQGLKFGDATVYCIASKDGLEFATITSELIPMSGTRYYTRLLGVCPHCGRKVVSSLLYSMAVLGAQLENFIPDFMLHSCSLDI